MAAGGRPFGRESDRHNLPLLDLFTRHWNELPTPHLPPLFQMLADGFRSIEKLRDYISPEASSRRLVSPTITSRISNHLFRFGIHPSDAIPLHGLIPALTAGQNDTRDIGQLSEPEFSRHTPEKLKGYRVNLVVGRITVNTSVKPPHNTSGARWRSSGVEPRDIGVTISGDPSLGVVPGNQLRLRHHDIQRNQRRI